MKYYDSLGYFSSENSDTFQKKNFDSINLDFSKDLELRDWQRKAKKFFFEKDNNCIFEVSTGAGKTFCAIDILNEVLHKNPKIRVLIVVPKNVILETGWYKELTDFGIQIQKIGIYYGKIKEYAQITLTNQQNLKNIPIDLFDFLILDEVHNLGTKKMLKIVSEPKKYKLGLTATLKRMDNKHYKILEIFNYNVFKYTPKEALVDGILNPFLFYNISVDLDEENRKEYDFLTQRLNAIFQVGGSYSQIMKKNESLKFRMLSVLNQRKSLVNNYFEKIEVAKEIIQKYRKSKIIVFNQFNDQTSKIYWHLLDYDIKSRVLHSGIKDKIREKTLIDFRKDVFNVLLTSRVLDEGYNLPKLDLAIIMSGDSTDKQTVQRMGRVLRKKDSGYSLLFQVYCKKTIEERNAIKRSELFKNLASDYKDIEYVGKNGLDF